VKSHIHVVFKTITTWIITPGIKTRSGTLRRRESYCEGQDHVETVEQSGRSVTRLNVLRLLNNGNVTLTISKFYIWECIQKFPDWPPGARTANGTALCHYMQLYRYCVSQSSEFCRHNHLCCFSTSVYCCCLFRYRLSPETFGHTLVHWES
jgi:hypothetical protein